jgi:hypothetical protein
MSLWELLNPFHIKGITQLTWLRFNEFLYKQFVSFPDAKQAVVMARRDSTVDFQGRSGLLFTDFYDSLFEFLDSSTKSQLVTEYVRVIRRICTVFSASRCLDNMSLHTKHHLQGIVQSSFAPWMLFYLKQLKKPKVILKAGKEDPMLVSEI